MLFGLNVPSYLCHVYKYGNLKIYMVLKNTKTMMAHSIILNYNPQ